MVHPVPQDWRVSLHARWPEADARRPSNRWSPGTLLRRALSFAAILHCLGSVATGAESKPGTLRVCASTTDLASLASEVGGRRVEVYCLGTGTDDPHELELKPSFTRQLDAADLYLQVGLGIENAWLERLMATVRNASIKPGGPGNLNIGHGVTPLEGEAARAKPGSYHEDGNPHYLLDPIEGLRAAATIREALIRFRPEWKAEFDANLGQFCLRLGSLLVGEECARRDDVIELARKFETLRPGPELEGFLSEHKLGGWLGALARFRGRPVVGDHDLWPYFARRTGIAVAGYLEPDPGVPPTTRHLRSLVERMRQDRVQLILTAPYFDQRHVKFVADQTGARVVPMAHQTGARPGTSTYLEMLSLNFQRLIDALRQVP